MVLNNTVSDVNEATPLLVFSWFDYVVFVTMLAISGLIGIYYGCFGNKQNSTDEYLLGRRSMPIFPVAMSMIASNISGMAILGVSADVYRYGLMHVWTIIPMVVSSLACIYVYMPVFLNLNLITIYQYLDIRFGSSIKNFASLTYIFHLIIYSPVVIFIPCLVFNQATGYNINILALATTIFCVAYTAIGGLKTVLWTDAFQTMSIILGSTAVLFMGFYKSGDVSKIFKIAYKGERLDIFNFDPDPTIRDNFWTYAFGCTVMWLMDISVNQSTLQRLSAVPTFEKGKIVILAYFVVSLTLKMFTILSSLIMYARYADCDPFYSGKLSHVDQVVPYYVIDVAGSVLGLPGLFVAGIFAAGLSTVSTNLFNLSTIIYTDFLSSVISKSMTEKNIKYILQLIIVIVGIVDCCLVLLVGKFGSILQFSVSLMGVTYGTLVGLFTLGTAFPIANKYGALCGGVVGLIFSGCMVFGNLWYKYKGLLPDYPKPISTDGCNVTIPLPNNTIIYTENEIPPAFFRISFWYYPFYGCLIVVAVGLLVSFVTRKGNSEVRPELISPMFQFMLPKKTMRNGTSYTSINNDISMKVTSHATDKDIE